MLGNFSFGDYFKREAIEFAWQLSREVFGFREQDIWVTVFEGDEGLGLGPDEEAIERWLEIGVPRERIVRCPRSENFWQAGPHRAVRPVLGALRRPRRWSYGRPDDLPGGGERALPGVLEPGVHAVRPAARPRRAGARCWRRCRRTTSTRASGLNRMAAILQDKQSVFETDQFMPLIELGEELSGPPLRRGLRRPTARCGSSPTTRAR